MEGYPKQGFGTGLNLVGGQECPWGAIPQPSSNMGRALGQAGFPCTETVGRERNPDAPPNWNDRWRRVPRVLSIDRHPVPLQMLQVSRWRGIRL